jgi:peptidyl-prolyl cis-trans isomerase D
MAVIAKIRNQSGLLIGVIGVSMILFLLGGDFMSQAGGGDRETNVAEINGETVSYATFESMLEQQINRSYGGQAVSQQAREQMRQRLWSKILNEKLMFSEYDALGLTVGSEEIFNEIKRNNPVLAQYFTNPQTGRVYDQLADPLTGGLNPQAVLGAVKQMINSPEGEASWLQIEESIKLDRFNKKYTNLIKKGLNVTSKEAEVDFADKNRKASFSYVFKAFADIKDDAIEVTDADLQAYYNDHKHESFYQQKEPTRSLEYVVFEVNPSKEDLAEKKAELEDIKLAFETTKEDTAFVIENADNPNRFVYKTEGNLPLEIDTLVFAAEVGAVFGPYEENGFYKLAKLVGIATSPDSVDARHILIKVNAGDTAVAQAKADSLIKVIKANNNFAAMAETFSEDFGSAQEGGDLGWFTEGTMVKEFNDVCFTGQVGDMVTVVSQFGVHLIEIKEQTAAKKKVLVAVVDREQIPSKETFDEAFNVASAFSINNNTTAGFRSAGNDVGMRVADQVKESEKTIPGVENSREIIRWAYEASVGDVSEAKELGNKFVVTHLKEIREQGALGLTSESVKARVGAEAFKLKKAEMIKTEMTGASDLNALASKIGKTVQSADNVTFGAYSIAGVGGERKLIGAAFSLEQGQISKPIVDNKGVYVIVVNSIKEAGGTVNIPLAKMQMSRNNEGRADYEVFGAIEDASDVIDNRGKFY